MGFLSGLTKTTKSTQLKPWAPAAGPMQDYMNQLQGMPTMQAFGGNYAADMNPMYSGALNTGYNWGQGMMGQGQDLFNQNLGNYNAMLETQRVAGPRQFQYDQGLFDQTMGNYMPGLEGMVNAQGRMSSMGLQSNLGQLISQAGNIGGLSSNPMSKLGQGSAALQAQNTLNNQMFAGNLYNQAAGMANANAMNAGSQNLASGQAFDRNMLGNYGSMMNMGLGMQGTGLDAMNYAGSNMQKYDQFARDMQRQQFMDQQTIPMQDIQNRLGTFSGLASTFGRTKQTSQGSSLDGLMKGIGAIGSIAGSIYGMGGAGMTGYGSMMNSLFGNPNAGNQFSFASQNMTPDGYFNNPF